MKTKTPASAETPTRLLTDFDWQGNVYGYKPDGYKIVVASKEVSKLFTLVWDESEKAVGFRVNPVFLTSDEATPAFATISNSANAANLLTAIIRRCHNHPSSKGLVAKPIKLSEKPTFSNVFYSGGNGATSLSLSEDLTNLIPESENGFFGWFASGADPKEFGTLYIQGFLENKNRESTDVIWELRQVGRNDPVDSASWDDTASLNELFVRCLDADSESELIVASLLDGETLTADAEKYRVATLIADARKAFATKNRIKPRITADAVAPFAVGYGTLRYRESIYGDIKGWKAFVSQMESLKLLASWNSAPLFGFDAEDSNVQVKAVHAAYKLVVTQRYGTDTAVGAETRRTLFDPIMEELSARVSGNHLGQIVRVTAGEKDTTELWVVKNVELAAKYADAILSSAEARPRWIMSKGRKASRVAAMELYQNGEWLPLEVGH